MLDLEHLETEAENEGFYAQKNGIPLNENPYQLVSYKWAALCGAWNDGWWDSFESFADREYE